MARLGRAPAVLQALGLCTFCVTVVGVPYGAARFSGWGLILGVASALLLSLLTACVAFLALVRAGTRRRAALKLAGPLLSPFGAPLAVETVLARAAANTPPLDVARWLLGSQRFAAWIRPRAYDALYTQSAESEIRSDMELRTILDDRELTAIIEQPPTECGPTERFCSRCAAVYRIGVTHCATCDAVPLTSASVHHATRNTFITSSPR